MTYFPGSTAYFPESTAYFPESKSILPRVTKILPRPRWIECNTSQSLICQEVLGGSQWSSDHWPPPYINGLWLVNCGNLLGLFRSFLHFFYRFGSFHPYGRPDPFMYLLLTIFVRFKSFFDHFWSFSVLFDHFLSFSVIFGHFWPFLIVLFISTLFSILIPLYHISPFLILFWSVFSHFGPFLWSFLVILGHFWSFW